MTGEDTPQPSAQDRVDLGIKSNADNVALAQDMKITVIEGHAGAYPSKTMSALGEMMRKNGTLGDQPLTYSQAPKARPRAR